MSNETSMTPAANTPWEAIVVIMTGVIGATGLWRWIAARVARSDDKYDQLRDKIELLTARVSASEAREEILKITLARTEQETGLLREQNALLKATLARREKRLRELGDDVSESSELITSAGGE